MIDIALQFLVSQLNTYLLVETGSDTIKVKLSGVVDDKGQFAFEQEVIGCSVVNIEEERTLKTHLPQYTYVNGQHVINEPDLKLNLYIMFAANFKVYEEALKYLSYILLFFQTHPFFDQQVFPDLDPRIDKLTAELQSPSYEHWNQIWGFNGAKQLPSIIYKVRMLILQPETASGVRSPLTTISANLLNK
jgi:hypothetical protein